MDKFMLSQQSVLRSITSNTQPEESDLRTLYLGIIEKPNARTHLENMAKKLIEALPSRGSSIAPLQIKLAHSENGFQYGPLQEFEDQQVILIGRYPHLCDVRLWDETCSRVHAVIFPTSDKIYVVDIGSLQGIEVVGTNQESKSGNRNILKFEPEETIKLKMAFHVLKV